MSKRQKKAAVDGGEKKEHKPNWRETHASSEDIQKFLNDNILLRKNVVTDKPFWKVPRVRTWTEIADFLSCTYAGESF